MAGVLTTHVLDVSRGRPAAGVTVELWRDDKLVSSLVTNADGRCEAPLAAGETFREGEYELRFAVGAYFGDASFLDVVPVRFRVGPDASSQKYHVPLLVTPWSYSTYRGS
jgi:5-hydroxyisourate hydrolase